MNALLENRLVVGAAQDYDALHEEPSAEEDEAMREMEARQLQEKRNREVAKLAAARPELLRGQVIEAISDADNAFPLYLHQAINSNDECLVGKLIMRALQNYRQALAMEEVG